MDSGIPQNLKEFITSCIETVSQLEVLFIIYQNQKSRWTPESVSRELRTHPHMALKQMEALLERGILKKERDDIYSYAPANETIDQNVSRLFDLYRERPVAIITFIYTKPEDRLKGFADAFKLKKD